MKVKISSFLKERSDRFKPSEANGLGLRRLNKIDFSGNIHLAEKQTNTNMILIKAGDLVISGINVEKGALAVYQGEADILATIHYSSYEFDKKKINIDYFKWFLKSDAFKKIIQTQTKGGIKTELKPKKFLPLEISLPNIGTQKNILEKIQSIENEIRQLRGISQKDQMLLKKLRQSILLDAVSGKLVLQDSKDESAVELLKKIKKEKEKLIEEKKIKKEKLLLEITDDEIPYELPKGWSWCRLGEIVGYGQCEKVNSEDIHGDEWVLDLEDIEKETSRLICEETFNEKLSKSTKNKFSKGDVLYSKLRPYLDKVIIACKDGYCTTEILPIKIYNHMISNHYLRYFFKNPNFISHVNELTYGVKMPRLGTTDARNTPFPLPPFAEQKRIAKKVDKLMTLCDELELKIKENKIHSEKLMYIVLREIFENGRTAKN